MKPRMIAVGSLILMVSVGMPGWAMANESQTAQEDRRRHEEKGVHPHSSQKSPETSATGQNRNTTHEKRADVRPVYNPPRLGAPKGRIGGGTRTVGQTFTIAVLAPEHVGLTTQAQPMLYWYAAQPVTQPLEFTLIDEEGVDPLVEAALDQPDQAGIHRVRLADYGINLEPGRRYQWFIALIPDRNSRSRDILAGGMVERVDPSAELLRKLDGATATDQPAIYAEEGIWYDAFHVVSDDLDRNPQNRMLRDQRAALLEQVGLGEISREDRAHEQSPGQ